MLWVGVAAASGLGVTESPDFSESGWRCQRNRVEVSAWGWAPKWRCSSRRVPAHLAKLGVSFIEYSVCEDGVHGVILKGSKLNADEALMLLGPPVGEVSVRIEDGTRIEEPSLAHFTLGHQATTDHDVDGERWTVNLEGEVDPDVARNRYHTGPAVFSLSRVLQEGTCRARGINPQRH